MKKEKWETVYKVCNFRHQKLVSTGSLKLEYEVGKEIVPETGSLFAFDSIRSALMFFESVEFLGQHVYKAEGVIDREKTLNGVMCHPWMEFLEFWKSYEERMVTRSVCVPQGTILCSKIKLIERVVL